MDAVALGGCRVHLMAVVRGLASESERVRTAFEEIRPDAVAVSLGREELEALKGYSGGNAPPDNVEEEGYVRGRSRFGEVRKPPPASLAAVAAAGERGILVHPLDMDEEQYTSGHLPAVSTVSALLPNARP